MKTKAKSQRPRSTLTRAEREAPAQSEPSKTSSLFADYAADWVPSDEKLRAQLVRRVQLIIARLLPIADIGLIPKDVLRRIYELADDGNELVGMLHDGWLVERGEKKARSKKYRNM